MEVAPGKSSRASGLRPLRFKCVKISIDLACPSARSESDLRLCVSRCLILLCLLEDVFGVEV
jgi:hypothetical protein